MRVRCGTKVGASRSEDASTQSWINPLMPPGILNLFHARFEPMGFRLALSKVVGGDPCSPHLSSGSP
jgi:hypothetical protein